MTLPINQKLIKRTDNRPNNPFKGGLADYITIHMTGNRTVGANAANHAKWVYDQAPYSWHATTDDKEIWQHLRWDEQGWHAGDGYNGPGNQTSLAIEIAMNAGIDQEKAYDLAAQLTAKLRKDGHGKKGIVQHNHWTGKNCPELIRAVPGRWERFLEQVKEYEMGTGGNNASASGMTVEALNEAIQLRMALMRLANEVDIDKVRRAVTALRDRGYSL